MSVVKSILKISSFEAVIKVSGMGAVAGLDDTVTISLNDDIVDDFREIVIDPPRVSILGLQWAGEPGAVYRISRQGTKTITLTADNGNFIDFVELFPPEMDETYLSSDIVVTITTANGTPIQGEVWLRLRKLSGYISAYENDFVNDLLLTEDSDFIMTEASDNILT